MERALALIFYAASASLAADRLYATSRSAYSRSAWHISQTAAEETRMSKSFNANGMRGLFREAIQFYHE